ncbi:MAG: Clp protease ClpP [Empedobacter falsenii]
MKHEIKIYGDIVPFKWANDGSEFDLKDLNNALSTLNVEENDELIIGIHTYGGDTATAFGILNTLLRFKRDNNITLTTRVDAWCASSGVIILLAGDKRIGNAYAEPFIHNAWTYGFELTAEDAKKAFEDLTKVNNQIASLYADRTNISQERAIELMNADNFVTAEDALAMGFYTELENVYVTENALVFNSWRQRNSKNNNMSKDKNAERKTIMQRIEAFLGGAKNKIVFTADNSELDFFDLDVDATPTVGDKARFEGKPAVGDYVMTTGETYKFTDGELTEIIEKEEEKTELEIENENLKSEIVNLKSQVNNLTAQNSALTTEKTEAVTKLSDATAIINSFKNLSSAKTEDEEEEDENRDGKAPKTTTGSRLSNAFNNLKNKNNGDN